MDKYTLIIDDDQAILDGFKEILAKERFWVDTALNAEEGLRFLTNRHYHVVVMDVVLKETTGIELIQQIKQRSRDTAVIMVTGYPTTESAVRSFRAGADDYLIKPVKKEFLLEAIRRILQHEQQQQTITSLRRMNEAYKESKLEKEEILRLFSKEIGSIADGITGQANFLLQSKLNNVQADTIHALWTKASYMRNLSANIQDAVDLETGRLQQEEKEFDLRHEVDDIFKTVYPMTKFRPVQMSFSIEPEVPQRVKGDARRFRQLLMNLMVHAVKATEEGDVRLHARLMATLGKGCHVFFTIKDGGQGIPRDKQLDLFKSVTKQPPALPRPVISRLDLWMSKVLVEKMGGLISIHSEPGQGNEFRFSIRFTKD